MREKKDKKLSFGYFTPSLFHYSLIFILLWINLGFCEQLIVAEGKVPIVRGNIRNAYEQALNKAMEDAVTKTLCLVLPKSNKLIKNAQDFIISYSILQQNYTDYCQLQIEAKIDWKKLAKALDTKGIISTGDGKRVLLFLKLPLANIDFQSQILPIWKRFFLVFGLSPIVAQIPARHRYARPPPARNASKLACEAGGSASPQAIAGRAQALAGGGEDELLDYAYKSDIPLVFAFSLEINPVPKGWQLTAKGTLRETTRQKIIGTAIGKSSVIAQETGAISALVKSGQDLARGLAPKLARHLHLWLKKQKQNIHRVTLRVSDIHAYSEVFTLLKTFREIRGMRYICLSEISAKEVAYEGHYANPIPYLINELTACGFSIDGVKKGRILLHK